MWKLLAAGIIFGALLGAQPVDQRLGQPTGQPTGQPRAPRPWWDAEVAKNANLSEAQQKQVKQIRHEFTPRMIEVRQAVIKADAEVAAAFNEEPVDQGKANEAINHLASARAEMTRTVSQLDLKLRTILTAQQWQEMRRPRPWPDRPGGRRRGLPPPVTSTSTSNPQK
jgi:Spy/CpxP family protein refolding chaperone